MREPGDGPRSLIGYAGQVMLFLCKILIPIILLAAVAMGILYVRLMNGPISLSFLAGSVAKNISAELQDLSVSIEDFIVELRGKSFEFRLRNVRLADAAGKPVAVAPLAASAFGPDDYLAWFKANQTAEPQFVDGDVITYDKADLVRPFIPEEFQSEWIFEGMEMTINDAGDLSPSDVYK